MQLPSIQTGRQLQSFGLALACTSLAVGAVLIWQRVDPWGSLLLFGIPFGIFIVVFGGWLGSGVNREMALSASDIDDL